MACNQALITIEIGITKKAITNQTQSVLLNGIIDEFTNLTIKGCELKVFILDMNTTNFHTYAFDYLQESKLSPRKWLLHNIIYSITCDKTKINMSNLFDKILDSLWYQYRYSTLKTAH